MFLTRAARQLPYPTRLAYQARPLLALRLYADQATARQQSPAPNTKPDSTPIKTLQDDVPNATSSRLRSAGGGRTSDRELSDLISKMMPNRPSRQPRPTHATRLSSADEVAAELDRLSSNPLARRQGQFVDRLNEGRGLDHDILEIGQRASKLPPLNPPVRCDAYIGRSETVGRGTTLARAFEKLSIKLAINKVRHDIRKQRFHERPGLRRKRLKSERWRSQFKKAFTANVKKVQKMTKKGW